MQRSQLPGPTSLQAQRPTLPSIQSRAHRLLRCRVCVCVSHVCTCTQKHTYIPALKATPVPRWQMDIAMGRDQLQRNTQRQFRKGKDDTTVKSSPLRQRELNRFGNGHYLNTTAFALLFPLSSLKTRKLIDLRSLLPLYQTVPLRELKRGTD